MNLLGKRRRLNPPAPVVCKSKRSETIWPTLYLSVTINGVGINLFDPQHKTVGFNSTITVLTGNPHATYQLVSNDSTPPFSAFQPNNTSANHSITVPRDLAILHLLLEDVSGNVITAVYVVLPLPQ